MARRLAKLAAVSRQLDSGVEKKAAVAAIAGVLGRAALGAGKFLAKRPVGTLTAGVGALGAVGSYRQHKAGFDPEVQKAMLGDTPVPPGAA